MDSNFHFIFELMAFGRVRESTAFFRVVKLNHITFLYLNKFSWLALQCVRLSVKIYWIQGELYGMEVLMNENF